MFLRALASLLVVLVSTTGWPQAASITFPNGARFVLPPSKGTELLRQCSRATPTDVKEFWAPSETDIAQLEQRLLIYLGNQAKQGAPVPPNHAYVRQYVGFIKSGTKFIYGNFFPEGFLRGARPKDVGTVICDGGPSFWGIVFTPDTGKFEPPQFNGVT